VFSLVNNEMSNISASEAIALNQSDFFTLCVTFVVFLDKGAVTLQRMIERMSSV